MVRRLEGLYADRPWFAEVVEFFDERYSIIEKRLIQSFKYVQLHPDNADTFSYEFNSILKDCGKALGSALDKIMRRAQVQTKTALDAGDFRDFLVSNIPTIHQRSAIPIPASQFLLIPFRALGKPGVLPEWWASYDQIKHSETHNHKEGNFRNAMNAVAALDILRDDMGITTSGFLFEETGIEYPLDTIEPERILYPDSG